MNFVYVIMRAKLPVILTKGTILVGFCLLFVFLKNRLTFEVKSRIISRKQSG